VAAKKDAFRRKYAFTEEQEEAFLKLLNEELEEEIVVKVPNIPTIPQSSAQGAEERREMAQGGRLHDGQRPTSLHTLSDGRPRGGAGDRTIG
jgi:hypothetical protein